MRKLLLASLAVSAASVIALPAMADSLTPSSCPGSVCDGFSSTIKVGQSTSITNKVGTISAGSPTSAQADVLFISDTTGSMSPAISQVQSVFGSVVSSLSSSISNLATGAAQYKDRTTDGSDPFDYNLDQAITTNPSSTQTAIGTWSAGGGGDDPEQALYALTQAAGSSTGWRAGSKKIAVIVGDAPAHDPGAGGVTLASTAAALSAAGVTVESLNASNLTGDTGLNDFGQFSGPDSIYDVAGSPVAGSYTSSLPTGSALATELESLIGSAFATYDNVSLDLTSLTGGCTVSLPTSITGSFDRSVTNTFDFGAVGISGVSAGVCDFTIALEADGAILATETDSVDVTGANPAPEPASVGLFGLGVLGLGYLMQRRRSV